VSFVVAACELCGSSVLALLLDDEYRAFIDKYSNVRNDFEARMTEACKVSVCLKRVYR